MAGDAKIFFGRDQLNRSRVFFYLYFMTCSAARCNRAMDVGAFGFVIVAFQTLGRIYIFLKRDRMLARIETYRTEHYCDKQKRFEEPRHRSLSQLK